MLNLITDNEQPKVFELTAGGLKPINLDGVAIGQRVEQAHKYEIGTVCEKTMSGFTVIFDDGSESHGQTVGALSPYTRITAVEPFEIVTEKRVAELKALRDQYREAQRIAREEEARQLAADTARITAELRAQYPWAASSDGMTGHARASKNLKKELGIAFPGVKFSVRSDSFSGGDSLDVYWTLGPTAKQAGEIALKYKDSDFDGMTNSTNFDNSAYGRAVESVLGRTRFVSCHRETSADVREKAQRGLCELQQIEYAGPDTYVFPNGGLSYYHQADHQASLLIGDTSFPLNFNGEFTVERNDDNESGAHWAKIVFPVQAEQIVKPEPLTASGISVTENEEKNGVEIRFDAKPADDVRDSLKSNGFRWSRPQSMWYAKRNPQTLAFAQSLVS